MILVGTKKKKLRGGSVLSRIYNKRRSFVIMEEKKTTQLQTEIREEGASV